MLNRYGMSDNAARRFELLLSKYGFEGLSFEELTHSTLLNVLTTDVNTNPASPTIIPVFEAAIDAARITSGGGPGAASPIRATRDPVLDGRNKLPGNLVLGVMGIRATVLAGFFAADANISDEGDAALALVNALEGSTIKLKVGGDRAFEVKGNECMNYGPAFEASTAKAITANGDGALGVFAGLERQRDITPILLGDEQEVVLEHIWDRQTTWPSAFKIRYDLLCQVARKR